MNKNVILQANPLFPTGSLEHSTPTDNSKRTVRYQVFSAVTMKNAVFWDATPCDSYRFHHRGDKNWSTRNNVSSHRVFRHSMLWLLVTASTVPSAPILVTLMIEGIIPL
jgi:hypothetical protein